MSAVSARAATEGAVETIVWGANGQVPVAKIALSPLAGNVDRSETPEPSESSDPMEQWCFPPRRQQAGRRDSSILPVQPDRSANPRPEANALAGPAGPRASITSSKMEIVRRIRFYRTPEA